MRKSRSQILVEKSVAAMVSAIEVYNKPDHRYREETFCILALNAWELLCKAKLLADAGNELSAILVRERRNLTDGTKSKRLYIRKNRSGNPATIGLDRALGLLQSAGTLPVPVAANLRALTEVRDNAVHYVNRDSNLGRQVQEFGTASLQNYVGLARQWFDEDLGRYNFFLMPLAFFRDFHVATTVRMTEHERGLNEYLEQMTRESEEGEEGGFSVRLSVAIALHRSGDQDAPVVRITSDPTKPALQLAEEDIRQRYPWDYSELVRRLRARYSDFKLNEKFHAIRRPLLRDPQYVMQRLLDPSKPEGVKKPFHSSAILTEFDTHYSRQRRSRAEPKGSELRGNSKST